MVRLARNARLVLDAGTPGRSWMVLELDDEDVTLRRTDELEFRRMLRSSTQAPHRVATVDGSVLWMYREECFWAELDLTQHEVHREIALRLPPA